MFTEPQTAAEVWERAHTVAAKRRALVKLRPPARQLPAPAPVVAPCVEIPIPNHAAFVAPQPIGQLARIVAACCKQFNVTNSQFISAQRSNPLPYARHCGMYIARLTTTQSLPVIGRAFGNRDHTTVIHGSRRIQELIDAGDEATISALRALCSELCIDPVV